MAKTYAVVDAEGLIVNRVVLDDDSDWAPEEGHSIVEEKDDQPREIGGTLIEGAYKPPLPRETEPPSISVPQSVLSQDIMAQFSVDDLTKIKGAVDGNIQFWGLWSAMQAQSAPMVVSNARFQAGWAALVQVLGAARMAEISGALGVSI